jgi:predicted subunit of tRNA(5-methylaminomethyl-2-thiouridylate) methyltransferase
MTESTQLYDPYDYPTLELRDEIAMAAMKQLLEHALDNRVITHTTPAPIESLAGAAYAIADAMIRAKQKISAVKSTPYEEDTYGC